MPEIEDLQNEYDKLARTIEQQNELRNSGSDDYDFDAFDRAIRRREEVARSIKESGGTPGSRTSDDPAQGGQDGSTLEPPSGSEPPDARESTTGQLESQLDQLRNNPPHPGVRLEGGVVTGGTAEDLKTQIKWRGQVEKLEHELTAAQAEESWAQSGGPDGFSDTEMGGIEKASEKIDGIQTRLDDVKRQIEEKNELLDDARGQLNSQTTQGGGPNAAAGGAIAVGARITGELRPLYKQQAAITQELLAAREELAAIIRARVRTQLEASDSKVEMPKDGKGKAAVEDAFLRRVYQRLGLPYDPTGASGLLRGLDGAQSAVPGGRNRVLALVALIVILVLGLAAFFLINGSNSPPPAANPSISEDLNLVSSATEEAPSDSAADTVDTATPEVITDEVEIEVAPEESSEAELTETLASTNAGTYEISAQVAGACGTYDVFLRMILFLNGQMTVDQLLTAGGNAFQSAAGRWDSQFAVATFADSSFFEAWFFLFNLTDIITMYNVYGPSSPVITPGSDVDLDTYAAVSSAALLDQAAGGTGECASDLSINDVTYTPFP